MGEVGVGGVGAGGVGWWVNSRDSQLAYSEPLNYLELYTH